MQRLRLVPRLWLAAIIGVVLAAYGWTLAPSRSELPGIHGRTDDYFNLLAHGFLKGHLYLDKPVPPELLALPHPYDAAQRPPGLALHDTSLYDGRYYIYWGPTPVVLVFAPFILLTGQDLPIEYGVLGFVVLGFGLCLTILFRLRSRVCPRAGSLVLLTSAATIGLADFSLFLIRRHSWYELPIACGSALALAALYFVLRGLASTRPWRWAAAAGLAVGLAVGARPVYVVAGGLLILPCFWPDGSRRWGWREVLAGVVPAALAVAALLAYNYARFRNPLEFGVRYQLSGGLEAQVRHFSLTYVPFNADAYLFAPLRWQRYFPFFHRVLLPPYPAGYGGSDSTFGVLVDYPFVWLALGGLWALARERRLELGLIGGLAAATIAFLLGFVGAIGRYMGDFGPILLLFAALGACVWDDAAPARLRPWFRSLVLLAGLGTIAVAVLTSFTLYDLFKVDAPRQYAALSRWSNGIAARIERASSRPIAGPLNLEINLPDESPGTRVPILQTGWEPDTDGIVVEYAPHRRIRLGYLHGSPDPSAWSPSYPLGSEDHHRVRLDLGSLYPPADHPFFRDRGEADQAWLKGWVRAVFDDEKEWRIRAAFFESTPGTLRLGPNVIASSRAPIPRPELDTPETRTYRGTLTLQRAWAGRSLPLISSGNTGAGDTLMLRADGQGHVRFAYDHWNASLELSPAIAWDEGAAKVLTFSLPEADAPLVVQLDGRTVWSIPAKAYLVPDYERYPGRNAIDASTCETVFPGADFKPVVVSAGDRVR